jgi:ABC-type dipeptide/oligopeptide/nickel transport system permease component
MKILIRLFFLFWSIFLCSGSLVVWSNLDRQVPNDGLTYICVASTLGYFITAYIIGKRRTLLIEKLKKFYNDCKEREGLPPIEKHLL